MDWWGTGLLWKTEIPFIFLFYVLLGGDISVIVFILVWNSLLYMLSCVVLLYSIIPNSENQSLVDAFAVFISILDKEFPFFKTNAYQCIILILFCLRKQTCKNVKSNNCFYIFNASKFYFIWIYLCKKSVLALIFFLLPCIWFIGNLTCMECFEDFAIL